MSTSLCEGSRVYGLVARDGAASLLLLRAHRTKRDGIKDKAAISAPQEGVCLWLHTVRAGELPAPA